MRIEFEDGGLDFCCGGVAWEYEFLVFWATKWLKLRKQIEGRSNLRKIGRGQNALEMIDSNLTYFRWIRYKNPRGQKEGTDGVKSFPACCHSNEEGCVLILNRSQLIFNFCLTKASSIPRRKVHFAINSFSSLKVAGVGTAKACTCTSLSKLLVSKTLFSMSENLSLFSVFNSFFIDFSLKPNIWRSRVVLPLRTHAFSTAVRKEGWLGRKLKYLKGRVPTEGRGHERSIRQGVWSENSYGRKEATLPGKASIQWPLTKAWSNFLVVGAAGHLLVQVWWEPWNLRSLTLRLRKWSWSSIMALVSWSTEGEECSWWWVIWLKSTQIIQFLWSRNKVVWISCSSTKRVWRYSKRLEE